MKRSRCAPFSCALVVLLSTPAFAIVRHVPGDYATIQAAIDASVVGDVVEVACGTYQVPEIVMKSGITLRSATGESDCVVISPVPIAERLLTCVGNVETVVEGITFQDGDAAGALYFGGAPRIARCTFFSNSGFFAGASAVQGSLGSCGSSGAPIIFDDSDALVTDCDFIENNASAGGIRACGSNTFENCRFTGNYGSEGSWGAIGTTGGTFVDCEFRFNHGYFSGGAAECYQATFQRCVFEGNWTGISGGAVTARQSTFQDCLFYDNWTGSLAYGTDAIGGGAIRFWGAGQSSILGCTFWGNDASPPRATTTRTNQSAAVSYGAAIWVSGGSVVLSNNIINGNTGSEAVYCTGGSPVSADCSNIFGNPFGDWTGCLASQLGVNDNISVDPLFCDPENDDFYLSSLSPCLYSDCGIMGAFGQGCFDEKPALFSVSDVGNDQGRQVRLIWQRSLNDAPSGNPFVVGYGVYRKRDQFAASEPKTPVPQGARGEGAMIPGWDYLGAVPSRGDSLYETVVPTLCDSTVTNGQCQSTFFISAMTSNPFIYWDSPPHSGYSKDNLAPPTPTGFGVAYNTGEGNHLTWDAVAAGDFAGFNIYRSLSLRSNWVKSTFAAKVHTIFTSSGHTSAAGELVATTTQTTWTDPSFDGWDVHYEVTSFDVAGNESAPAIAGTTTPVPSAIPSRLDLLPNIPNPFNPTTTIRFSTPGEGPVRIAIFDARGSLIRVLIDKSLPAGHHDAVWDGRDGKGSPVSSGVYLVRLEQRSDFRTRKIVLIK